MTEEQEQEQLETAAVTVSMYIEENPGASLEVIEAFGFIAEYIARTMEKRGARMARLGDFVKSAKTALEKHNAETIADLPNDAMGSLRTILIKALVEPEDGLPDLNGF